MMAKSELVYKAELIYKTGIESVMPAALLKSKVFFDGSYLSIESKQFAIHEDSKIYVIGAGKAAAAMAKAVEEIIGDAIYKGIVIVKYGHAVPLKKIIVHEAAHPVPDSNGLAATNAVLECINGVKENDIILFLLSGGASSLLIDIPEGASLKNVIELYNDLLKSGASIHEFNTVRKHLSKIKGGGLLKYAWPATVISLIISDVPNDDLSTIGSGPTISNVVTVKDARKVLVKYGLWDSLAPTLKSSIQKGLSELQSGGHSVSDTRPDKAYSFLLANNKLALTAASVKASSLGYDVFIYPEVLEGEAVTMANEIVDFVCLNKKTVKTCFLFGAEATVKVNGNGKGGRCQEMVLAAFKRLKTTSIELVFFAAGTDGQDGPTEVAGAVIDRDSISKAKAMNLNETNYLLNNDSYNFFKQIGGHVITGPTYTNVMDMVVVLTE
jgi:hydroxypyruvate reductase